MNIRAGRSPRAASTTSEATRGLEVLYVVRHAIAADRTAWSGPDRERPLTPEGVAQAAGLVALLGNEDFRDVLSSPALRCRETVAPLAAHLRTRVMSEPMLEEGTDAREALRFLLGRASSCVACTHGDVIMGLVDILDTKGLLPEGRPRYKKASTWVLRVEEGELCHASYLPPP